jgi:phage tail protein
MQKFVMMALGVYRFALATAAYQQLNRQCNYHWSKHARVGKGPLKQYMGEEDDQISLSGVIFPEFRGGTGQVAQMRLQAGLGLPLPLISGVGNYLGLWVITSIGEGQEIFWADGKPRKIEFQLNLEKYNELTVKILGHNVSASGLLGSILGNIR